MIVPVARAGYDGLGGFVTSYLREFRRHFNSADVSTALRPFYFSVHPDLFGQYPTERLVNENSLKTLSGYLETVQQQRVAKPVELKFYLKPGQDARDGRKLRSVQIILRDRSLRRTVVSLLESCNLSTSHVKPAPTNSAPKSSFNVAINPFANEDIDIDENDPIVGPFIRKVRKKNAEDDRLKVWLEKHKETADRYHEACRPIRSEIERLKTELCGLLTLKEIKWDCGWNISHFRGALQSFQALCNHHPNVVGALKGKTLIFGSDTGVNLDGAIMLNCGEVRHNWLDVMRRVQHEDEVLLRLPAFERAVSRVLRDIRVVHRKFQPKVMAGQYESQLRRLTTSLSDYQGRLGYPKKWPQSLSEFELVVETEAGPLMLSPTGQFIVPSSCPAFLMVHFITENLDEARRLLNEYSTNKHVEDRLVAQVTAAFALSALRKDDNITPSLMIKCCERLLKEHETLQMLLQGGNVLITTYYSLLTDGQICFPWNWKM